MNISVPDNYEDERQTKSAPERTAPKPTSAPNTTSAPKLIP